MIDWNYDVVPDRLFVLAYIKIDDDYVTGSTWNGKFFTLDNTEIDMKFITCWCVINKPS